VARERAWPGGKSDGRATARLERWWASIVALDRALPADDEDAHRYIERQITEWFAAQQGVLLAKASAAGSDVPHPELRAMPRGLMFGLRRP
jgi:hypothetical protein